MLSKLLLALSLVGSAKAFAPVAPRAAPKSTVVTNAETTYEGGTLDVMSMPGITNPVGFFDPLGLSTDASSEVFLWLRAAELKHSRVAMLASTGWMLTGFGVFWPGKFDQAGDTWASLGTQPLHAWAKMCEDVPSAPYQILVTAGCIEAWDELRSQRGDKHYVNGGYMGLQCDPLGFQKKMSPEKMAYQQNVELNNGRLAMLGIASFYAAATIDGSVPYIPTGFEG